MFAVHFKPSTEDDYGAICTMQISNTVWFWDGRQASLTAIQILSKHWVWLLKAFTDLVDEKGSI